MLYVFNSVFCVTNRWPFRKKKVCSLSSAHLFTRFCSGTQGELFHHPLLFVKIHYFSCRLRTGRVSTRTCANVSAIAHSVTSGPNEERSRHVLQAFADVLNNPFILYLVSYRYFLWRCISYRLLRLELAECTITNITFSQVLEKFKSTPSRIARTKLIG